MWQRAEPGWGGAHEILFHEGICLCFSRIDNSKRMCRPRRSTRNRRSNKTDRARDPDPHQPKSRWTKPPVNCQSKSTPGARALSLSGRGGPLAALWAGRSLAGAVPSRLEALLAEAHGLAVRRLGARALDWVHVVRPEVLPQPKAAFARRVQSHVFKSLEGRWELRIKRKRRR